MGALDDKLNAVRHGDAAVLEGLLRRTPGRAVLYAAWLEAAHRPAELAARPAVLALEEAQRAGGATRLARTLAAKLSGGEAALKLEASRLLDSGRAEAALLRLRDAFTALDPAAREVVFLCDFEYLRPAEAMRLLVVSELVLAQRLNRSREQLRGRLRLGGGA